jgi:hypothetical protein
MHAMQWHNMQHKLSRPQFNTVATPNMLVAQRFGIKLFLKVQFYVLDQTHFFECPVGDLRQELGVMPAPWDLMPRYG